MNWIFNTLFGFFIGRFFKKLDHRFERDNRAFEAAQKALAAGNPEPMWREWQRVSAREQGRDMVADNTELRVARAWGADLMARKNWAQARPVFERALGATAGLKTELIELFFQLADCLLWQDDIAAVRELVFDNPMATLIERLEREWPPSDQAARLAQYRFDFALEARLRRKAFEPTPRLPDELSDMMREAGGTDNQRWRDIAMAHYNAGEITRAVEAQTNANDCTDNAVLQVGGRCLLAVWRRAREGDKAVAPLLAEARQLAGGNSTAAKILLRQDLLVAAREGDWDACAALSAELNARSGDTTNITIEADNASLRGEFDRARAAIEKANQNPTNLPALEAFRGRCFPALTRGFVEVRAHYSAQAVDLDATLGQVQHVAQRLQGDRRLMVMTNGALAGLNAALGNEAVALELARALEAQWDEWADDTITQTSLASLVGATYFTLQQDARAIAWYERDQLIEKRPVYLFSNREVLAHAHHRNGDEARARELWQEVAASGLRIQAVELARAALS